MHIDECIQILSQWCKERGWSLCTEYRPYPGHPEIAIWFLKPDGYVRIDAHPDLAFKLAGLIYYSGSSDIVDTRR